LQRKELQEALSAGSREPAVFFRAAGEGSVQAVSGDSPICKRCYISGSRSPGARLFRRVACRANVGIAIQNRKKGDKTIKKCKFFCKKI
jgi:hypothetical protein